MRFLLNLTLGLPRAAGILLSLCGTLGAASGAAAPAAATEFSPAVVELPAVEVRDSRAWSKPESWRYSAVPGFEILANAPDSEVRRLMMDFQLFCAALNEVWRMPERPGRPALLILCDTRAVFESFLPEDRRTNPSRMAASVCLQERGRAAIVLDCGSRTTGILSKTGEDATPVERDRELYRQYIRLAMSRIEPRPPAWFEEGIAQIAKAIEFDRKSIVVGKVDSAALVSPSEEAKAMGRRAGGAVDGLSDVEFQVENRGFNALLQGTALMPFERFFAIERNSSEAIETLGNNVWPQQAYAFVHFCLYGDQGRFQKPFAAFMRRLAHEPASESLFNECFHLSYDQMLVELRGYMDFTMHTYQVFRAKGAGLELPREIVLREATAAEVGRIKGEALELAGRTTEAGGFLLAPYVRGEHDARLLAALGLFELRRGQPDRAWKFLEGAARDGQPLPAAAWIELARLRLAHAISAPDGASGKLGARQVAGVIEPLWAAQKEPPPKALVFELLAETWGRAEAPPPVPEVERLLSGAQLFPTRLGLVFDTAVLCQRVGLAQPARALAEHGIKHAEDAVVKRRFEQLASSLAP